MKNKHIAIKVLTILPIVFTLIALPFMPDTIPMHYNASWQVDRMGSKYELLTLCIPSILMYILFYFCMRYEIKKKDEEKNIKILEISFIVIQAFQLIITICFGIAAFNYPDTLDLGSDFNTGKIVYIIIAGLMIILGGFMPKAKNNAVFGLRTKWSRTNDLTWQKSQRFGGVVFIITGIAIILVNIFVKKSPLWEYISLGMILLLVPISLIGSYIIYKKHKGE